MPIFGTSMEPELHTGSLILIEELSPSEVKEGDIIVFTIPAMVREQYNYPPVIAHRVIKVTTQPSLVFRTKGDNTGEDPFTVRAEDIRGTVSTKIPYIGFPLLFLQSNQGLIFIIIGLCLFALYLYSGEISQGKKKVQRGIFAPVIHEIEENEHSNEVVAQKIEGAEKKIDGVEQALGKFAIAIGEYAKHLQSHTSAIQGLAEASQELKKGAAEQNKVLAHLLETKEQPPAPKEETTPKTQYKVTPQPPQSMPQPAPKATPTKLTREEPASKAPNAAYPPGCFRSQRRLNK